MSINYCISGVFAGSRRAGCDEYNQDRSWVIRRHIEALHKYKHNLDQITLIINKIPDEPKEFREYINTIPSQIQDTKVVIYERENKGISYGAFSEYMGLVRNDFDYHIFVEDDFYFCQDFFPEILINIFNKKEDCACLCALFTNGHSAMPHSLISKEAINRVWDKHGCIPHGTKADAIETAQVAFSYAFTDLGMKIYDWLQDGYCSYYYNFYRDIHGFGDITKPIMIKPVQMD